MAFRLFSLCTVLCLMPLCVITLDQASFYGSSFISIPFKEAKSSTDIHFKFRTHLSNALILLVAGTTDYCIVRLDSGRLKVNINLGAGESELLSSPGIKLNDFKWHDVFIVRKEANLSILIDNIHSVEKQLPGKFFELNIHYGLFLGGHGNYSEIFFGHLDKFRGCLSEVMYNGILVLDQARRRQSQVTVHGVTWNCASEFDASIDKPISFVEDGAFMTIPHLIKYNQIKIQFEIKTIVVSSMLIYNLGHTSKPDFFAIEIWKGNIKCTVKHSDKLLEITNDKHVSDGNWHKISLHLTPTAVDLIVDSTFKSIKNPRGYLIELNEIYFIGGLEVNKRARAMSKGLKIADISFKGCMQYLTLSDQKKGLPDVHVSEGLLPGCVWQYPCLKNPCHEDGICTQKGLESFHCQCNEPLCVSTNYTEGYKIFSHGKLATELEILSVEPLQVLEGQSIIITSNNLHMILDYVKYGIRDSNINFTIIEPPAHGSIDINIWPHEKNSFTLLDVSRDKIYYVHDGSEDHLDHIALEVEFSAVDSFILPSYLQGKFKFILVANIIPINDPPVIDMSSTSVLRLAQGSKKIIDSSNLYAKDPDSPPQNLVFTIMETPSGHFEYTNKAGVPISSFTQADIDNSHVAFIHHNTVTNESYISIQVSDGIKTSAISKLRVSTFPQYWRLQNNTGLILMHETSAIITPYNLSFVSNVPSADDKAQFHVMQGPQYGVIEVEKTFGLWENAIIFTSDDLKQHRVRYRHITSRPEFDEFQFQSSLNTSTLYTFRMKFRKCLLFRMTPNVIYLNATWECTLQPSGLGYQTEPIKSLNMVIVYKILNPPKYGYLFSAVSKYRLRNGDTFTQEDITSENIKYKLHHKAYSYVQDTLYFAVTALGCKNVTDNLTFIHYPSKEASSKVQVFLDHLRVEEGARANIVSTHLNIKNEITSDLIFNITQNPIHGILQVSKKNVVRNDTHYFTLSELNLNQLYYIHDDSETKHDSFEFLAFSRNNDNFLYIEKFYIDVLLKNDNSPVRSVDKVFNVVVGGQRLLTGNDLRYTDVDLDTLTSSIVYTTRELTNGDIYNTKNDTVKITEFTQEDLDYSLILFKHKGPEYGKVKLWVTDGQFYVNGILEIQASAPFLHVFSNKKLIIQIKKSSVITNEHLYYSTNLYAFDKDIVYEIVGKPNFGKIISTKNFSELTEFTQEHINSEEVSYIHESDAERADEISFRIKCRDTVTLAQLGVWMFPSSYWDPITIRTLKNVVVEEATSAVINKDIMEVTQHEVPADSLTYYVLKPPENGYLSLLSTSKNADQSTYVNLLTQSLINENRVIYIQSGTNQTKDQIIFNVTNGIVWLDNVILNVIVIPEHLYLGSNTLSVNEGGTIVMTSIHLFILTEYYKSRVTDYVILQEPLYGCVQVNKKCNKLHSFTHKELINDLVQYSHDGSENLQDEITLVAVAGQKRSIPLTLVINVVAINDQVPVLINNTGLTMWEGGKAVITNSMLAAVDFDRPKDTLRYHILGCWWGNISVLSDPNTSVQFFTQELIDSNLIIFRHQNGSEAKFDFNITDGLHSTKKYTFHIKTKPVTLKLYSKRLHIFPLQRKFLTSSNLLTIVSDPERVVTYEVITPPTMGRLMMESQQTNGIFTVVNEFTQQDLNDSKVFYEHTHPFADLYVNDSFIFNIKGHLLPTLLNQKLKIDISVSSGGLDVYVNIPKITVLEGGMTNIPLNLSGVVTFLENHAGLRSPVIHTSASIPQHGQVFLQNTPDLSTFTQQQIETGQVYYQHDHSDSLGDNIYFSLYLIPGYILLCNITVPIIVNPINDQPFKLVTRAPHLSVVQGESHIILKTELLTEDADTSPSGLKYDVIDGPFDGQLVLLPNSIAITHFTQSDINENKLIYIHNGSHLTDNFHLRVWDDVFRPEYTICNVRVLPVNVNVSAVLPVYLQQGSNVVLLSDKQFVIETNANKQRINYKVKTEPKHGVLYVKDVPAVAFNQSDLDSQYVMYMQTDMTTANDSFQLFVGLISGNVTIGNDVEVVIKVQPLMQIGNFTVITGDSNKITLHVLDATPLAKLTSSNPIYTITRLSDYGQIKKIIRSTGEKRNVLDTPVHSFTHEEVQSGLIYFVAKDVEVGWNGLTDQIEFLLAASIFQPAVGVLKITLRSSLHNDIFSTLAGPSDPAGHEGGMQVASPNMTRDYFLIVSMVAGVVILGVTVIIIIKCRSFEPEELNKEEQCLQPIPLPRPPDRLMVSSPSLKQHMQDGFPSPLPTALPHCKVTPLNRNELDTHACYPYGVDEHPDDWSSCDASDPTCPGRNNIMLRRNQYWV